MPIDSLQRGQNTVPTFVLVDPSNTVANASIKQPQLNDGVSYDSTVYGPMVGSFPLLLNASGLFDRQKEAPGAIGIPSINTEGTKMTYSAAISAFAPPTTATDFWQITGGSKTIRVLRISISGIASPAAQEDTLLIKRTTANTGGVIVAVTSIAHDSQSTSATAVVNYYTTKPSGLGTGVPVRSVSLELGAAGTPNGQVVWDFTTRNGQGIVLRTSAQSLCLNWGGGAVPGGTDMCIDIEWEEE